MGNLSDNERAALNELKAALMRDFRLVELRLIGSKARGDARQDSDIDVVVVLESYDWETEKSVYDVCHDIGFEHGVFISPALYARKEYESGLTRATPFYQNVARDGITV